MDDAGAFELAEVSDVVQLGDDLVAVGHQALVDALFSEADPRGLVWTSPDGESWAGVTGPGVDALVGDSTTTVRAAAASAGGVVAVGTVLNVEARRVDASFWAATDPQSWIGGGVTGEVPADVRDTIPVAVCTVGETSVAVGRGVIPGGARGLVWTSREGQEWQVAAPDVMAGPGSWHLSGGETTPEGIVAVGGKGSSSSCRPRPSRATKRSRSTMSAWSTGTWSSSDGSTPTPPRGGRRCHPRADRVRDRGRSLARWGHVAGPRAVGGGRWAPHPGRGVVHRGRRRQGGPRRP